MTRSDLVRLARKHAHEELTDEEVAAAVDRMIERQRRADREFELVRLSYEQWVVQLAAQFIEEAAREFRGSPSGSDDNG